MEKANKYIASKWRLLNRDLDTFFSNDPSKVEVDESRDNIKAYFSIYKKESDKLEKDFDIKLRINLPKTTQKLKLVVEREQDDIANALSDENFPQGKYNTVSKKKNYSAGFDYLLSRTKSFRSNLQFGMRLSMPIDPSVKLDFSKDFNYSLARLTLFQKFIYYRQEGYQQISQMNLARHWTNNFQTDFINSLVWTDEEDRFVLRNNLIFYYHFEDEHNLSLSLGANALFRPNFHYDSYDISLNYRRPFLYSWLFIIPSVGMEFVHEENFKREYFGQLKFEIYFE